MSPKFWRAEVTGELGRAVELYLHGRPMTKRDIALMRFYLRQWIDSPVWDQCPSHDAESLAELAGLRETARMLFTAADIHAWLHRAMDIGIDPL